ncbi:MAG: response regulator [Chloroflexi bacterium]|nr:response regulator [Chloroflexota bacterium]
MTGNPDPILIHRSAQLYDSLDLPGAFAKLVGATKAILPLDQAAVILWDKPATSCWVADLAIQDLEMRQLAIQPATTGQQQRRATDHGWPRWTHHYIEPGTFDGESFFASQPSLSRLCSDLRHAHQRIGLLYVGSSQAHLYGENETKVLQEWANLVSPAIANVWKHELLRRKIEKFSTLIELQHSLVSTMDEEDLPSLVARKVATVIEVGASVVCLLDDETKRLEILASHVNPYGEAIRIPALLECLSQPALAPLVEEVFRSDQPVVFTSVHNHATDQSRELLAKCSCETLVALPLQGKRHPLGLLLLADRRIREFSPDDQELVQAIARQLATMLERQQLLSETAYLQEFTKRTFEAVRDIIYVHDLQGNLTLVNRRATELTGYTREELLNMNIRDLIVPQDRERVLSLMSQPSAQEIEPYDVSILTKEGIEVPVQINASPLYEGNRVIGVAGVLRDQREQKRWQEQLVRNERLRALGQMSGSIAHDFNNLLAVVMGRVQLALREAEGNIELSTDLEAILEAAQEGAQIVRRIQNFTRKRTDRITEPVNVNTLIREVVEFTQPTLSSRAHTPEQIEFTLKLQPVPAVAVSESELREALFHLVRNAIEALPEGGHISFQTERDGEQVVVQVADDGLGIPRDILPRVFEPFYTTKGPQYNGLGLSSAYGTITRYGGEIDIESVEGERTIVRIRLPIVSIPKTTSERQPRPARQLPTHKLRILVIEDETPVRNLVAKMLRSDGHHVVTKADGTSGLEAFSSQPFDIVFTDLGMPGISGWEVAQRIRAQNDTIPIVLVTGWGSEVEESRLAATGVTHVITKPFRLEEMQACLNAARPK